MSSRTHTPDTNDGIVRPSFERVDERGSLHQVLNSGRWECLLCGRMKAQAVMGNHYHKRTEVFFFLASGAARVTSLHIETGDRTQTSLSAREGFILKANVAHAIRFFEDSSFIMLKSLRYDTADPDTFPYRVIDTL